MSQTCTVLFFSLIFLIGATIEDRCSNHSSLFGGSLTECPSIEKFNLIECYDEKQKNYNVKNSITEFWCWSRRDNDEKIIKNVPISTARVRDEDLIAKIKQPFTTQFTLKNGDLKCDTMEKWASESVYVHTPSFLWKYLPCATSTLSVAVFKYCNPLSSLGWLCSGQFGM